MKFKVHSKEIGRATQTFQSGRSTDKFFVSGQIWLLVGPQIPMLFQFVFLLLAQYLFRFLSKLGISNLNCQSRKYSR